MTTASIAWETAFAPGFTGVVCAVVEGVPVLLCPAGVHPTATAVTSGTVDPLWHFGTGSLTVTLPDGSTLDPVVQALDFDATWVTRETTKPVEGDVECEPLRLELYDQDSSASALLSAPLARVARGLSADVAATGNIPLDGVIGVPAAGLLHIGRECVGYSSLSGSSAVVTGAGAGRGLFGSTARAHVVGAGTRRPLAVADTYPRYWTGRRIAVFLCELDGATLVDPSLVFLGVCGAGVAVTSNLMRWQVPADHITTVMSRRFSKVAVRAFGFQHGGATLTVNFENTLDLGPTDGDPASPGWSAGAEEFLRYLNAKGSTLSPVIHTGFTGGRARITATGTGGDIPWSIIACWDSLNPRTGRTPNLGENTAFLPECSMHLDGLFAVRREGDWDLLPSTLAWTASTPAPGRAHAALVADTDNSKRLFARIVSRDATNRMLGLIADVRVSEDLGAQPVEREIASRITKPTEAALGVLADGDTALGALRALAVALDDLQGTDGTADAAIDWEQIARTFARIPLGAIPDGRSFRFTGDEDSLLAPLIHECRLRGAALCIRKGRVGAYRPAYLSATEGARRAITEEDLLPGLPVEVVDGLEPVATGIKFTLPDGGSCIWRDSTSAEEFGEGKTIVCKALESATGIVDASAFATDIQRTATQLLGVLAQPTRIVRIVVGPSFWSLSAGDILTLTHSAIPDLHGNRGLSAVTCQVMESRKSFGGGQCRVQLALLVSDDASLAGYAPSALVGSISGAVVTIDTTSPWGNNCFALDVDADDNAITNQPLQGFAVGDKVYLSELNNETPMADEAFTISSLTATTVTLSGSPTAPMVTAAASRYGCLLRFAPWTDGAVTARQRKYLFIADHTAEDLGSGDAPKRWS